MNNQIDSVGALLTKSWELYKKHWEVLLKAQLVCLALCVAIVIVFSVPILILGSSALNSVMLKILSVVAVALFGFSFPKIIHSLENNQEIKLLSVFGDVFKNFGPLLLISILFEALVFGGTLALVVPGIFFATGAMFYFYTGSLENKKGLDALIQSYWYSKDKKWSVFYTLFFIGIISVLLGVIFLAIVGVIIAICFMALKTVNPLFIIPVAIIIISVSMLLAPINYLPRYFLYKNIKSLTTETVDPEFYVKYKKLFKIFITIGLVLMFVSNIAVPILNSLEKTYKNETFSYSIVYPGYFKFSSKDESLIKLDSGKHLEENILVFAGEENTTDAGYYNIVDQKMDQSIGEVISEKEGDISVGGNNAKEFIRIYKYVDSYKQAKEHTVYVKIGNKGFIFDHNCYVKSCDEKAFDRVLKTFKSNVAI